uniref:Transposase n=1 Tax=Gongylonema pulchrum TaxID=637853 RepID=A0A183CUD9_9BILA
LVILDNVIAFLKQGADEKLSKVSWKPKQNLVITEANSYYKIMLPKMTD